jgi:hypothetical protein
MTIENARESILAPLTAAADWASNGLEAGGQALRLQLAAVFAAAAPFGREIAAAVGVALTAGIVMSARRARRRRHQLEESLVDATLGLDPNTDWHELAIVVRNLQPQALLVRSIQVLEPAGTKICERWRAWQSESAGVKFVAPELQLTDAVAIERTVLPYGSDDFVGRADELIRQFYVRVPRRSRRRVVLRARLICELKIRRGLRQELMFRCKQSLAISQAT